jgi:hypothetical protein
MSQKYFLSIFKNKKTNMENFKKFLSKNFTLIVFIFLIIGWLKGCGDSKELGKINDDIKAIKDSTYTKTELDKQLKIMSLETEKRFIQSTDRKILDVNRQAQIDLELENLK